MSEALSTRSNELELGVRIQRARQAAGLSQKGLGQAVGLSVFAVDRIESGRIDPTAPLHAIADATRKPPEWFLRVVESEPAPPALPVARTDGANEVGRWLVLGTIVVLVTIRFFTEVIPVVPRAANFIDIPLFLALIVAAVVAPPSPRGANYFALSLPAFAFGALAIASAVVNTNRVAPAPVIVFIYGFLAPLAVFAAAYRIWPPGNARSLSRVLVGLGIVQLTVVVLIDVPRFASTGNADKVSGTFGTNAYQLVFFLLVVASLLVGISTLEPQRLAGRFVPVLIPAIFVVILLAQYRALLATTVVTMVVVGVLLGRHARGLLASVLAVVAFALVFSFVASNLPVLKLDATATTLTQSPWSYAVQRLEAARPVTSLYRDQPAAGVIGTGPGTFSSRAWQTFALTSTSDSNVQGPYARLLTGGTVYTTDVSQRYVVPQIKEGLAIEGSRALTLPYSSYLGLAAEVGLLGLALVLGIYVAALLRIGRITKREIAIATGSDPVPALAVATTIGFLTLLQMGFLENWLEVTRITFLVWLMFAVVAKELDSRTLPAA